MGKKGKLLDHSLRERAGSAPEERAAAQSPGAGSSPVYLPSLPFTQVTPAALCRPSWHRAHAGTGSDTVPALPPLAGAATPPAPAAPLASAPLPRQGCARRHWLVVDDGCGHAESFLQALLLFQLREGTGRETVSAEPPKGSSGWLPAGQRGDTGG